MEETVDNKVIKITKERNYWLDNAKFLLILLVVIGHFIEDYIEYNPINYIYTLIYLFHMPLFVFITGFFCKNFNNRKSKIVNYAILYLIMQVILLTLGKTKFSIVTPKFSMWYLQVLIAYNLFLPIINTKKPIITFTISLIMGLIIGFDSNAKGDGSLSRIFVMLPFFLMGFFMSEELLNKLKNRKIMIIGFAFLLLIGIITLLFIDKVEFFHGLLRGNESYYKLQMNGIGILYRAGWYILTVAIFLSVLAVIPKKNIKFISKFGSRTLQIYCLQAIAYVIFENTPLYFEINTPIEYALLIVCSILLTIIFSLKIFSYPFNCIMKINN